LAGVKTTENLIYTALPTLLSLLPAIPKGDLEDLIEACVDLTEPSSSDGFTAYEVGKGKGKGKEKVGWGLEGLDGIISEWDGVGIVELSGPRRVGKSVCPIFGVWLKIVVGITCCS
jgi:DNA repair protein RAD51